MNDYSRIAYVFGILFLLFLLIWWFSDCAQWPYYTGCNKSFSSPTYHAERQDDGPTKRDLWWYSRLMKAFNDRRSSSSSE